MIKREKDIKLIGDDEKIIEKDFERLQKLQEGYGINYHIHPYNIILKDKYITSSLKNTQPILKKILEGLDKKIHEYKLYPLITIHMPRFGHPKYNFDFGERKALDNSIDFFQNLNLESKIALETMHDPYRNDGHALLGYKAEHFSKLIGEKNFGICIDTGHTKMASEKLEKFLEIPCPLYSIHLNGNDGTGDQHLLPTKENVGDFEKVIKTLKKCAGPIVFEIKNRGYSRNELKNCIEFWKNIIF